MSASDVLTNAASLGIAIPAGGAILGLGIRTLWRFVSRVRRFLDDFEGTPERPGVPAVPGLMERVRRIEYELPKNGKPTSVKIDEILSIVKGGAHDSEDD